MKKSMLMIAAAVAFSFSVHAQSVDEGIRMLKYERYGSAERILQPLAAGNPMANYYLGLAQLGTDKKDAARATFSKYPDDPANMAGMARLAFASNNAVEGQRIAQAVADKAKKKEWQPILFAADAVNYGNGSPQVAIDLYKKALERADNQDIRIGLGDAYQRLQGGGGEAMNNYENVTGKDPKNSLAYSRIGALWYSAHNYQDALINYSKAKDADPNNPLPYRDLANAYFNIGKFDLAKQNIEEYLKHSDQSCDDKILYANILFLAKDYPTAISKMQEVISSCSERPYMYRVLGWSQYETKDYTNAMQNMRLFFSKQDPNKPGAFLPADYLYYGKLFSQMKQADSADFYYTKAISTDTSSNKTKVYTDIAESYKSMNTDAGYTKAAEYYGKAVDAAGANAKAIDYFWWGAMFYYAKNYPEAARVFEQMETKFPDEPSATYWRGRVGAATDKEGKTGVAVPFFTKWLAIPNSDKYTKKPTDMTLAYQYLAVSAYNRGDKSATKEYINKLKEINPADPLATQLEGLLSKPGAGAKAPPTPPKTPAKPAKK